MTTTPTRSTKVRNALLGIGIAFVFWWGVAAARIVDPFFLPGPLAVGEVLVALLTTSIILDLFATLARTLGAFALAALLGVPLGLVLGKAERVYYSIEFFVDLFRSTPATALFPLFMLFLGIGDVSKIAAAAFGGFLIILFNTAYGVINSKKTRILAARLQGASRWQIFKWIVFWESLPQTFVGLRNAISLTLTIVVIMEMFVGTNVGIGRRIIDFQVVFNVPAMYAAILLAGIMGYVLNTLLAAAEHRIVHWNRHA